MRQTKKPSSFFAGPFGPTQRRRHTLQSCAAPLQLLLPRYHFALPAQCRPLTRSPAPHCVGLRTPLTEGSRLELHGRACITARFPPSCSQVRAKPRLAAVLHNRRLSVSGDTDRSFPVHCIWLMNCYYNIPFPAHLSTLYKALNLFLVMRINFARFRPVILGQIVNKI